MKNLHIKKFVQLLTIVAIAATNSIEARFRGIEKLANLNKDQIRELIKQSKAALGTNSQKPVVPMQDEESEALKSVLVTRGSMSLGHDKQNQPIKMGYLTAGKKNDNCGTIICYDIYFGREGYLRQAQLWALKGYYVVAFDGLSGGASTFNSVAGMDGIGGYESYSFQQAAYLIHEVLENLGVQPNTAATPLTFAGIDSTGSVAIVYADQYRNDKYSLSFLAIESADFCAITSDDPCQPSVLSVELANAVADAFEEDACGTLCFLYSGAANQVGNPGNFTEPSCPIFGNYMLNQAVSFAASTPPDVFRHQLAENFKYNPAPLMETITIPVLMLYSGLYQLLVNKQINGIGMYGWCGACQAGCTTPNYVLPFPNSIMITYQNAGLLLHVSRTKRFNDDVSGFIKGTSGECDPFLGLRIDSGADCATCPTA